MMTNDDIIEKYNQELDTESERTIEYQILDKMFNNLDDEINKKYEVHGIETIPRRLKLQYLKLMINFNLDDIDRIRDASVVLDSSASVRIAVNLIFGYFIALDDRETYSYRRTENKGENNNE